MSGAPPFRLRGTHFTGALVWLLLGGAGLVAGLLLLVTGTATASVPSTRAGAGTLLGGSLLVAGQYARIFVERSPAK